MAKQKLAIVVGGGPAPGINSVIGAATIHAIQEEVEVIGIRDGFKWLMQGNIDHIKPLTIEKVSRIHFLGGSYIGISRANPTKDETLLEKAVNALLQLDVDMLITIGGDDTAYSSMKIAEKAAGAIRVVHVPKTIDNDLDLPPDVPTFGFNTAKHLGVELVKNLMVDAQTTSRWYYVVSMGRKAGHLALGIGRTAGATLTLIPEEFPSDTIKLSHIADILVGAIIKRRSSNRLDGVAILAEGLVEHLDPDDLKTLDLEGVDEDEHGHIRLGEISIGEIIKQSVQKRLNHFGIKTKIISKNIGYELRCADPIPFDMEYTRDLGYCAAEYIVNRGGNKAMVSMQGGHFVPIPFKKILDPKTGRTTVRMVTVNSESFRIARNYMIRLGNEDFEDRQELAKLAVAAGVSLDTFRDEFSYLLENDRYYIDEQGSDSE